MLSHSLRLNFWHLKIIQIFQPRYKPRMIGYIVKDKQKNKCLYSWHYTINPLQPGVAYLYLLKTLENI